MLGRMIVALIALAVAPAAMAQTSSWRVMTEMGEGQEHELVLLDTSSLATRPTPDMRELMVASYRVIQDREPDGEPYNVVRLTYRFDCKARTVQRIRAALYQEEAEVTGGPSNKPMEPVERGTLSGDLFEPACSGDFSKFPPIQAATPAAERERRFGKQ